jgi:hypothetical protein
MIHLPHVHSNISITANSGVINGQFYSSSIFVCFYVLFVILLHRLWSPELFPCLDSGCDSLFAMFSHSTLKYMMDCTHIILTLFPPADLWNSWVAKFLQRVRPTREVPSISAFHYFWQLQRTVLEKFHQEHQTKVCLILKVVKYVSCLCIWNMDFSTRICELFEGKVTHRTWSSESAVL